MPAARSRPAASKSVSGCPLSVGVQGRFQLAPRADPGEAKNVCDSQGVACLSIERLQACGIANYESNDILA